MRFPRNLLNRLIVAALVLLTCAAAGSLRAADKSDDNSLLPEPPIEASDRDHWSWRPLTHPTPPKVKDACWCSTTIDRFILARLEQADLRPMPEADRGTLLRRVSVDLTGLGPTPAELDAYLNDKEPGAYERAVDRLLASPAYGERWAQHWLDLARFAETDGFEHDKLRPKAWRYRDWVIDAFNRDLPYDEFVRLQLAGDELYPGDEAAAVATGFCLCGPDMPDINLQAERRHFVMNDLTSNVGSTLLGLQVGCAQCHDHKYDPISQADFYRLRAIFEPAVALKDNAIGRTLQEASSQAGPSYFWIRGDFRRQGPALEPDFPRIANLTRASIGAASSDAKSTGRRAALALWITRSDHPLFTRVIVNRLWQFHFGRGLSATASDFGTLGDEPSHPELLDWLATEFPRLGWSMKSMHRLIVRSATYRQASRPTQTDWNTEQMAAAQQAWKQARSIDPENLLLARMRRRRMEGEAIRDCLLLAADRLSPLRGGPGVMTPLPKELTSTTVSAAWQPSEVEEDHRRRSIYLLVRRNLRYPLFEVFDGPDTIGSCPQRNRSTTAPQALLLLNSEFSLAAARDLAGLLYAEAPIDPAERIKLAYCRLLARPPSDEELRIGQEFLTRQAAALATADRKSGDLAPPRPLPDNVDFTDAAALVQFCLAMCNLNEFVYVD